MDEPRRARRRVYACSLATLIAGALVAGPAMAQQPGAAGAQGAARPLVLGIVLYPGFEPLDVFGPLEMIMNVGADRLLIHMIAQEAVLVPSSAFAYSPSIAPKVQADFSLADAPPLDIIMVPGGYGTIQQLQNEALLGWLRQRAPSARFLTSVCSGSAILAKAGLLDDRKATSNKQLFSFVTAQGPEVDWQKSARWVEDGAIITSSGVSAGIDMALALIAKLYGVETAEAIANGTEYVWHRDPSADPFTQYLDQAMPAAADPAAEPKPE